MLNDVVENQVQELQNSPFEEGSEITRYYNLLPECDLKATYREFLAEDDPGHRAELEAFLRRSAVPGKIEVNIMTKLDHMPYRKGQPLGRRHSDATTALRGYAHSRVSSCIVFSAGLNSSLYGYLPEFEDFMPDSRGVSRKTVTLKVSDYRSAIIQGRFLAKRGIWVSEFRVESGLNCGGHAFASKGFLLGPILEEFRTKRGELTELLHRDYNKGLAKRGLPALDEPRELLISVQGGIGTASEHSALLQYYKLDHAGWATPFLLVPEVTCVDDVHLERLCAATAEDVCMSNGSPMGIPFWLLKTAESEQVRKKRIADGTPGSPCPKGFLRFSTEFSERPMCRAARNYQKKKLTEVEQADIPDELRNVLREDILAKACICHDLAGGATIKYGVDPDAHTAVCPSGNIAYFDRVITLEEMVDHIYGRVSLLKGAERPHMFIREIGLYIEYLYKELERFSVGIREREISYYAEFKENLMQGIQYYQKLFTKFVHEHQDKFVHDLSEMKSRLEKLKVDAFA
jgi:hypothetical protein